MTRKYLTIARSISLVLSGIGGLLVANLMLQVGGESIFARYALLTGISAIFPFVDLGIGYKINSIILDQHAKTNPNLGDDLNRCFTLLVTISLLLSTSTLLLYVFIGFEFSEYFGVPRSDSKLILAILLLTFSNVPLSVGSRVLLADGQIIRPIIYGMLGTVLSMASLSFLLILPKNKFTYLSVVPMLVMNLVNLGLLRYVQNKTKYQLSIDFKLLKQESLKIINFGAVACAVNSTLPISLQIPKYILGSQNLTSEISEYSLFLLFLQPLVAVSSFSIYSDLPKIRRILNRVLQKKAIFKSIAYSLFVGLISTSFALVISLVNFQFPIRLISSEIGIYLFVLVPLITLKQIFISIFTKTKNMLYILATSIFSAIIALVFLVFFGIYTAKSVIGIFLLTDSLFSTLISILLFYRHLFFLRRES